MSEPDRSKTVSGRRGWRRLLDLTGQVCSDSIDPTIDSGFGRKDELLWAAKERKLLA